MNQDTSCEQLASILEKRLAESEWPGEVSPDDPAGAAVRESIARGTLALLAHEPMARQGDPEGVHQMRTAARRLRGELRAFKTLLDVPWAEHLEDELRWLGRELGDVRDLDVLRTNLAQSADGLQEALQPLFAELDRRHEVALDALREALQSARFQELREQLALAALGPQFAEEAEEPCRKALPPLVAALWKKLKKCGRALRPDDPDEKYHEVRKRAKRVRYAAEAAAPALGPHTAKSAERFARRARAVQDVLGRHQDAVVACRVIEQYSLDSPQPARFALAAGRLLERQAELAREARAEFPKVWDKLDSKKLTRWLK